MNITDSYVEGFCKTAEACGVDPEQLLKTAAPGLLGRAVSMARSGYGAAKGLGSRYLELMRGGNADTLGQYNSWNKGFDAMRQRIFERIQDPVRRGMAYKSIDGAQRQFKDFDKGGTKGTFSMGIPGLGGATFHGSKEIGSELAKVRAARLGTGLAGAGIVGGAMLADSDGSKGRKAIQGLNDIMRYSPYNPMAFTNMVNDTMSRFRGQAQSGVA